MNFTNRILVLFLSWRSVALCNILLFILFLLLLRDHLSSESFMLGMYLTHINFGAISSLLVAWGVLLESRHLIIHRSRHGHLKSEHPAIQPLLDQFSVAIVAIGLLMEVFSYFRDEMKLISGSWLQVAIVGGEWILVMLSIFETLNVTYHLLRIKKITSKGR